MAEEADIPEQAPEPMPEQAQPTPQQQPDPLSWDNVRQRFEQQFPGVNPEIMRQRYEQMRTARDVAGIVDQHARTHGSQEADEEGRRQQWRDTAAAIRERSPGSDVERFRGPYERARLLQAARGQEQEEESTGQRVMHQVAGVLGPGAVAYNLMANANYDAAMNRYRQGNPTDADYITIARHERHQAEQAERESTTAGYIGQLASRLPGEAAGFGLAGRVVGPGASLLSRGAIASPGAFAGALARTAATTALNPTMYAEDWQRRNLEAGRSSFDLEGATPAFANGLINTAVLGSLTHGVEGGRAGVTAWLGRTGLRGAIGLGEQQIADTVTSAISEVLPESMRLNTGYGTLGSLARGEDDAWKHLAGQALTFTAFAAMHGRESHVLDRLAQYTRAEAARGTPRAQAASEAYHVMDAFRGDISHERASEIAARFPEGPARNLAESIAKEIHEQTPAQKEPERPLHRAEDIEHTRPVGPEYGYEPYLQRPGGPETAPAGPEAQRPAESPQTAPEGEQRWVNTGTDFGNQRPDGRFEFESNGKKYTIEHTDNVGSLDHRVVVRDAEGHEVAHFGVNRNEDGTYSGHVKTQVKGLGRVMYDYAHSAFGEIKPSEASIGGKRVGTQTGEGEAFWRRNAEFAERQRASYAPDNGPTPRAQEPGGGVPPEHPAPAPGLAAQVPGGGQAVRPGQAPVPPGTPLPGQHVAEIFGQPGGPLHPAGQGPPRPQAAPAHPLGAFESITRPHPAEPIVQTALRHMAADGVPKETRQAVQDHYEKLERTLPGLGHDYADIIRDAYSNGLVSELKHTLDSQEFKDHVEAAARELSKRSGERETSVRRRLRELLQEGFALPEAKPQDEGGQAGHVPGEAAGPAEVDRGRAEDVGVAGPSAATARGPAGGDIVTPEAFPVTENELSRRAKAGDRKAADLLSRRINEELAPVPFPGHPADKPDGWDNWTNYQRQHYMRASNEWRKENIRLRNNGEATLADEIVKRGGIDKNTVPGDLEHWNDIFGSQMWKSKGKKPMALDTLAEEMKRRFPGEFGDQTQHPEERVLEMLRDHYLEDAGRQIERMVRSEQFKEARDDFGREFVQEHPEANEAEVEAAFREYVRQAGEAEAGARPAVEIVRSVRGEEEGAGGRGERGREPASAAAAEHGATGPGEFEFGHGTAGIGAAGERPAGQPTGGPEPVRGGFRELVGGLLKGESGTVWVPSKELIQEQMGKLGQPRQMAEPAKKEIPGVVYRDRQGQVLPPGPNDSPGLKAKKIADKVLDVRRLFILSGVKVLGKLSAASFERMAIAPMEEVVGAIVRNLPGVARIAAQAPREGTGFKLSTERTALFDGITKGIHDAWENVRRGGSELDVRWGGEEAAQKMAARTWLDWVGNLHAAFKAPAVRAEFTRSWIKRTEAAAARGEDVSSPSAIERIGVEAYKDSKRAKFQQENWAVDAYKRAVEKLRSPEAPAGAQALGFGLEAALPVVRIPTNIVAETFNYMFGLGTGSVRAGLALRNGIQNLKPEQAELIMRSLKKGSLGLAALGVGFFNPQIFGGFYSGRRDQSDVEAGGIRAGGLTIPGWLLHNPLLEVLQVGATTRRALTAHGRSHPDAVTAFGAGMMGLLEEVPFARAATDITHMLDHNPQVRGRAFGEFTKSLAVPQLFQWIAGRMDTTTGNPLTGPTTRRRPQTIWQHIETGIPGLRQQVPAR